jgi:hypothetical protein
MLMSILMVFGLAACAAVPGDSYDFTWDMTDYDFFSQIFEEKSLEEWESLGRYTMLLKGLHTPVVVHMDGTDVLSIDAFDQTVELGESGLANEYHDGFSPVYYIRSTQKAVVIRVSGGEYSEDSIVITKDRCHTFQPENGYFTSIFVGDDGALAYRRTWDTLNDFEQMGYEALTSCTGRDEPLYETGRVEIGGDDLVLTAEETVVLSERYDLDALFAEGKAAGAFEAYDSLDALLAANQK